MAPVKFLSFLAYGALLFFGYLMWQISWQYRGLVDDVAFLRIKRDAVQYSYYLPAFFVHAWSSLLSLPAGFTQFSSFLRRRYPHIHRWMGWTYAGAVLLFAAVSGLVLAWHANGGFWSQLAFLILGISWWGTTFLAVLAARKKNWRSHRNWMIRSYAFTLSAITLRIWKYLIVAIFAPPPMDTYRLVAWLAWVPNILIAEWIISSK
ncbi:MAG: DUF2306 domain-containing protein [Bacteroidota bacterium]